MLVAIKVPSGQSLWMCASLRDQELNAMLSETNQALRNRGVRDTDTQEPLARSNFDSYSTSSWLLLLLDQAGGKSCLAQHSIPTCTQFAA